MKTRQPILGLFIYLLSLRLTVVFAIKQNSEVSDLQSFKGIQSITRYSKPTISYPGQIQNLVWKLEFPPKKIGIVSFNSEMVYSDSIPELNIKENDPVPLDLLYLHHWLVLPEFYTNDGVCQEGYLEQWWGLGSEVRHTNMSWPYPYIVLSEYAVWSLNVHSIDLRNVTDPLLCTECNCKYLNQTIDAPIKYLPEYPYYGGLHCCELGAYCPVKFTEEKFNMTRGYKLKYTINYVQVEEESEKDRDKIKIVPSSPTNIKTMNNKINKTDQDNIANLDEKFGFHDVNSEKYKVLLSKVLKDKEKEILDINHPHFSHYKYNTTYVTTQSGEKAIPLKIYVGDVTQDVTNLKNPNCKVEFTSYNVSSSTLPETRCDYDKQTNPLGWNGIPGSIPPLPYDPSSNQCVTRQIGKIRIEETQKLVFATGHLHAGSLIIRVRRDKTKEILCESVPTYGKSKYIAGDELGFVVGMSTCNFIEGNNNERLPDIIVEKDEILEIETIYDGHVTHTGLMGLFYFMTVPL